MALFKHLFHLLHGFEFVWHDLPMKFGLHSQKYLWVIGSDLHRPWFEQFIKHELRSVFDWSIFNKACDSDCVKLFIFEKGKTEVELLNCDGVEELIVALKF